MSEHPKWTMSLRMNDSKFKVSLQFEKLLKEEISLKDVVVSSLTLAGGFLFIFFIPKAIDKVQNLVKSVYDDYRSSSSSTETLIEDFVQLSNFNTASMDILVQRPHFRSDTYLPFFIAKSIRTLEEKEEQLINIEENINNNDRQLIKSFYKTEIEVLRLVSSHEESGLNTEVMETVAMINRFVEKFNTIRKKLKYTSEQQKVLKRTKKIELKNLALVFHFLSQFQDIVGETKEKILDINNFEELAIYSTNYLETFLSNIS